MKTDSRHELPVDPFQAVRLPLAAYIDPDGWDSFNALKKRPFKSAGSRMPQTVALANRLFAILGSRHVWGWQYSTDDGIAAWKTMRAGMFVHAYDTREPEKRDKDTAPSQWCKPLRIEDLVKHLSLATGVVGIQDTLGLSRGANVLAQADMMFGPTKETCACIRIDVDANETWLHRDHRALRRQLQEEQRLADDLGLPYAVFRSGGRGTQAVFRLPEEVSFPTASFVAHLVSRALEARLPEGTHVDVDSTRSLLRLPGGVHARSTSFGLALWLDPDSGEVLPISEQVERTASVYEPLPDCWLLREVREIGRVVAESGLGMIDSAQAPILLERLSDSELAQRWKDAMPQRAYVIGSTAHLDSERPREGSQGERQDFEWARKKFHGGYAPNESQAFFRSGGIRAAFILYGPQEAERQLIEQACTIPASSEAERAKRIRTISGFCRTHDFWGASCRVVVPSEEDEEVLAALDELLMDAIPRKDWRVRVSSALRVCVPMLRESTDGQIMLSASFLVEAFRRREFSAISPRAARRALDTITEGHTDCALPVLVRRDKPAVSASRRSSCVYKAGALLTDLVSSSSKKKQDNILDTSPS